MGNSVRYMESVVSFTLNPFSMSYMISYGYIVCFCTHALSVCTIKWKGVLTSTVWPAKEYGIEYIAIKVSIR